MKICFAFFAAFIVYTALPADRAGAQNQAASAARAGSSGSGNSAPAAEEEIDLPAGGADLLPHESAFQASVAAGFGRATTVWVPGAPWAEVRRFEIQVKPPRPYDAQLQAAVRGALRVGDRCVLIGYARAITGGDSEGRAAGAIYVQENHAPWEKLAELPFKVGRAWQPLILPFTAGRALAAGEGMVALHLGREAQTLEVAGLRLLSYGANFDPAKLPRPRYSYEGRESDAAWRAEALARIETLRRGPLRIAVVAAGGQPVAGAKVRATLRRHAFGFGSAVQARWFADASPDGEKYRAVVEENFSKVVFENDLKPGIWERYLVPPFGDKSFHRDYVDQALGWLGERHIPVRGHYLMWGPVQPWAAALRDQPEALRERIFENIRTKVPVVDERLAEYDALNHPVGWEANSCVDQILGPQIYNEAFALARSLTRKPLWINEDNVFLPGRQQEEYFAVIQRLLSEGVDIGGIGNMAHHNFTELPTPRQMLASSDRFAALVPRLQITEFDVLTGGDEQLAADYLRDALIVCFSHRAYTGFLLWGFWENAHWKPEAALWRKDWSEKPAAKVWREWVGGKWRTDATLETDAEGRATVPAFYGRYDIVVENAGARQTLTAVHEPGSGEVKVTLP